MIYVLAAIGAYTLVRWTFVAIRTIGSDLKSKPTPWLMTPWAY